MPASIHKISQGIIPMSLQSWWSWFVKSPLSLKWFVLLILSKPIIDAFYFVKDSGLLSPAQIIGFLSFLLCLIILLSKKPRNSFVSTDYLMLIFGFFLFLNATLVYAIDLEVKGIGNFIRIMIPVLLFFYLRNEIKSMDDLNGLIFTFLLSSIFPYVIYFYEFLFKPIQIEHLSEGRGGGMRLSGIYADMFNYMAYIIGDFLIFCIYFTNRAYAGLKPHFTGILIVTAITILGLTGIRHQASWGVFAAILLFFITFNIGNRYGRSIMLVFSISFVLLFPYIWRKTIAPLYSKEINAYKGLTREDRALNGRIIRWKKYFGYWDDMPIEAKVLGVGLSNHPASPIMMSGGMHSDYVRFLFATGILGILVYIAMLVSIIYRSFRYPRPLRFWSLLSVVILMLYAISSNPFGSSGALLYLCLIGMVVAGKPLRDFVEAT
ncbi:MAG: O-antigen ligase family protein [Bacteroidetes bacterium]|nr:MAG: O-antigen ligase family protein [Bacteroidota bacterium]